jgi:hypothetical protein
MAKAQEMLRDEGDWQAVLARYIMQVSDAAVDLVDYINGNAPGFGHPVEQRLAPFILPEPVDPLVEAFRRLPLHGDAGCDKLTDDEWQMVAKAARETLIVQSNG